MKFTISTIKKQYIWLFVFLGISQIALCDDVQNSVNHDYLRTPEASAFKKYGEESVNEYTGTADISVPLYTIKSKDVEIPLVLRYDASGIKVEQEASWVGLGWNLMVGGCINYVCAGGHDMHGAPSVPSSVWTEYLTSEFTPWVGTSRSRTMYYTYNPNETSNWMNKLPYRPQEIVQSYVDKFVGSDGMRDYLDWGYGERDFYSVNVMGKSFLFFIDPATLKVFNIGKSAEDFIVVPDYSGTGASRGIGKQPDIDSWKITDSDGYVYHFDVGDKYQLDNRTGSRYTTCWYLTKIQTPQRETVNFEYDEFQKTPRMIYNESFTFPSPHGACCNNVVSRGHTHYENNENSNMSLTTHYLSKVTTSNQTVSFITSDNGECSGRKLDAINVTSHDGTALKEVDFSFGSFGYSTVGGTYTTNDRSYSTEARLKLLNVKEASSSDTLTTSFSYNETVQLPSKRSCAQDYWGYYNGQENLLAAASGINGHTMISAPTSFMSNHNMNALVGIKGADRFSRGRYMQAAILNRIDYPTGGHTTYEYEPNSINTSDFSLTETSRDNQYDVNIRNNFSGAWNPSGYTTTGNSWYPFDIENDATCDLLLTASGESGLNGHNLHVEIGRWNEDTHLYDRLQAINIDFQVHSTPVVLLRNLTLPKGRYSIGTTLADHGNYQFGYTWFLQGWYDSTTAPCSYPLECGGLRVKKISNYDNDGTPLNYTTYDYDGATLLNKIETIDYVNCYNNSPDNSPTSHNIEIFTLTPGHPRMPAFYLSCNPGIVGYSKVTKCKYNADNSDVPERRTVTSYTNNAPTNLQGMDIYTALDNGTMLRQEVYDGNGNKVSVTENEYDRKRVDYYATNIVTKNKSLNGTGGTGTIYTETRQRYNEDGSYTFLGDVSWEIGGSEGVFDVLRYPYILSRIDLTKTTATEYCPDRTTIVSTKEYLYNDYNQVSQIDESTSLPNQVRRTKITYTADGEDYVSRWMKNDYHILNDVVETRNYLKDNDVETLLDTKHTTYSGHYDEEGHRSYYLPASVSTAIGNDTLQTRAIYSYDDSLNVRSIVLDGLETVYIWSYKGQYPIAKIEGLTYAEVEDAIGAAAISTLLGKPEPTQADLASLRDAISAVGGLATTYTYKPLVGMESQTLPNGNTIRYEYDGFGRLTRVLDNNGSVISTNSYNYKQ